VVGAYYGKGKRTNVYGAFLLACYDPDSENFQTACKIGTGFSEQMLIDLYNQLHPLELTSGKRNNIKADPSKPPDVWFEPKVIFEVLTADLTLSPIYTAAQGLVSVSRCVMMSNLLSIDNNRSMHEEFRCDSPASSEPGMTKIQRTRRQLNK
jgi:ATP-dependent DNA ligase